MAIIIERTITINNSQATLDKPIYLYRGDGDIICLFSIKEKKKIARFGDVNRQSEFVSITEQASYGNVRIYKPDGSKCVFTEKSPIVDDKLQVTFSYENINDVEEVGVHKLQIHLYDDNDAHNESNDKNRFTLPPIDIHILLPIGEEVARAGEARVDHSIIEIVNEDIPTFDEEGNYNKTTWGEGDIITQSKLNKIEDALYEIKATGNDSVDISALEAELENKANRVHKHSAADITTGLARVATSGSYNDLSNKPNFVTTAQLNNKADSDHTHDDKYASNSHNHDNMYASNGHAHDNYSVNGHTHSGYASSGHGHDDKYAPTNHTHDYALTNHTHDDKYMTKTELESRYATKDYVIEYVRDNGGSSGGPGTSEGGNANIDDESISKYTVYSSSKVHDLVTQLSAVDTQLEDDLVDIDARMVYVEAEIAAIKDNTPNAGDSGEVDYVTEEELNTALASKSDVGHIHDYAPSNHSHNYAPSNHLHDDRYALKTDIPSIPSNVSSFTNDAKYIASNTIIRIEVVNELPSEQTPGVLYIVKAQ